MSEVVQSSYYANPITVLNTKEVRKIEGSFVYNFYLKNETTEYHTSPTSPLAENESSGLVSFKTVSQIENIERGSIRNRIPRYIKIKITPSLVPNILHSGELYDDGEMGFRNGANGPFGQLLVPGKSVIKKDVAHHINREGAINSINASAVSLSDSNVVSRTFSLSNRISSALLAQGSLAGNTSEIEIVEKINEITSEEVSEEEIKTIVCQSKEEYDKFVNDTTSVAPTDLDRKASSRSSVKISINPYQNHISKTVMTNPFNQNVLLDRNGALGLPSTPGCYNPILTLSQTPHDLQFNDVEPVFHPLTNKEGVRDYRNTKEDTLTTKTAPTAILIGYIIERTDGTTGEVREYVALEPEQTEFYDTEILYGRVYTYSCKQLYFVRGEKITENTHSGTRDLYPHAITAYAFYSTSGPSNILTVAAKEKTPPEPVSILFCNFIYKEGNGIRLRWQMPNNPTRDIKKYQVFRRKSIKEPFKIIAEYDFNDEGYPSKSYEYVSPSLCTKSDRPVYEHIDTDFQRSSSMIYSICAVDARGQTSTMGVQIRASFDRFANKLVVNKISKAGAPKPYPNLFLNKSSEPGIKTNLLEDVARDSGHGKMRLYFNPDTYEYIVNGTKENLVASTTGNLRGEYKFQIINLDRQKTKVLSIRVNPKDTIQEII